MENKRIRVSLKNVLTVIVMLMLMAMIIYPLCRYTSTSRIHCRSILLDEGWTVYRNDTAYEDVTLSKLLMPIVNRGDVVVLERTLPNDKVNNPVLQILSVHTTLEVYLDDKLLFDYGLTYEKQEKLLGYGTSYVILPDNYMGKTLRIVCNVTENQAFEGLQPLRISDSSTVFQKSITEGRIGFFIAIFLIVFGILGMGISVLTVSKNHQLMQTFCIAMFSILIGIWTLCNNDMMTFFVDDLATKVVFEYITFYLAPIPLTGYFYDRVMEKDCPKWLRIFYFILLGTEVVFFVLSMILQFTNTIHFPKLLIIVHIIIGIALLFVICLAINYVRLKKKMRSSIVIGMSFSILAMIVELIRYNVEKYLVGFENNRYSGTLCFCALLIVIALFLDFVDRLHSLVYKHAQAELLEELAYKDELTGLANRRRCDDLILEYKEKNAPYAMISLDMNYLKLTNDTYGHDKGDCALRRLSTLLQETFEEPSVVGRMGGDEFAVIIPEGRQEEVEEKIDLLQERMQKEYIDGTNIKLSFAFGYAFSYECSREEDAYAIYRKADERMYINKRAMKMAENKEGY